MARDKIGKLVSCMYNYSFTLFPCAYTSSNTCVSEPILSIFPVLLCRSKLHTRNQLMSSPGTNPQNRLLFGSVHYVTSQIKPASLGLVTIATNFPSPPLFSTCVKPRWRAYASRISLGHPSLLRLHHLLKISARGGRG